MADRIHHKMAHRDVSMFDLSLGKHYVPLCIAYSKYKALKPILEMQWSKVTCRECWSGKSNGVPDGMGLKLVVNNVVQS